MFHGFDLAQDDDERDDFEYNDEHVELESDIEEYGPDEEDEEEEEEEIAGVDGGHRPRGCRPRS